jgi:hypothetical protein
MIPLFLVIYHFLLYIGLFCFYDNAKGESDRSARTETESAQQNSLWASNTKLKETFEMVWIKKCMCRGMER